MHVLVVLDACRSGNGMTSLLVHNAAGRMGFRSKVTTQAALCESSSVCQCGCPRQTLEVHRPTQFAELQQESTASPAASYTVVNRSHCSDSAASGFCRRGANVWARPLSIGVRYFKELVSWTSSCKGSASTKGQYRNPRGSQSNLLGEGTPASPIANQPLSWELSRDVETGLGTHGALRPQQQPHSTTTQPCSNADLQQRRPVLAAPHQEAA